MQNEQNLDNGCLLSPEVLREVMIALPFGCQVIHPDGRILYVNAALARRFNRPVSGIPGQALVDLWPGIERTPVFSAMEQCMRDNRPRTMEAEVSFPDGSRHFCQARFNRVAEGVCILFVEIGQGGPSLEFEDRFRYFVENVSDNVYTLSPEGRFTYVSPNWVEFCGETAENALGKPFELYVHPDDVQLCQDVLADILTNGSQKVFVEYRVKHGGDTWRWHYSRVSAIMDAHGNITGCLGIAHDISRRKQMEEELRDNRNLLDATQQLAHVGGWSWDIARQTMTWTDETYRIHDFIPGEMVVGSPEHIKKSLACYEPEVRDLVQEAFRLCVEKGESYSLTCRFISAKGTRKWVQTTGQPVFRGSTIVKVIGNIIDITERKQAEEVLRQNQDMLVRAERIANIGSWEWDIDPDCVRWSEEMFRLFGRNPAPDAPSFAEQADYYAAEDVKRLREAVKLCVADGTPYELELRAIQVDGGLRHCVARGQALRNGEGRIYRLAGSLQDITERKQAEEKTRAHERYVSTILRTVADGFLVVGADGKIVDANEVYCRMTGYTRDELLSMSVTDLDVNEASDDTAARLQYLVSHGSDMFESSHQRKDGSVFPVEVSVTWLGEKGGRFISFCRDLTNRKRLQDQLLQAQKMEAVGRLAGGVAHDFNNMLGAILGHAELAMGKAPPQDESLCGDLKAIIYAANRSADITRQLLAFARKQTIQPKVLNLNQTIDGMLKMLRRMIGEDIDLIWLPGANLWPVKMDPSQVDQILVNLCVNARDAIEDVGKLVIATETVTLDEASCAGHAGVVPGDFVLLTVSDDGQGMDQQTLDKVFEPFFTTKGLGKGTGLGLATVYGIVQQNQGLIKVDSKIGEGTAFRIYLPALKEGKVPRMAPEQGGVLLWPRGSETILLVEDEQAILKMTTMMLELLGYTVLAAQTPDKAIAFAREHAAEIHLLMTDVIMPAMNGRELANKVLTVYPNIKCLFMSGYTANVIEHHGVMNKGMHFLQKPFSVKDVATKVRQALDES